MESELERNQSQRKGRVLTNKYGLPEPLLRAVIGLDGNYKKRGHISVTTLMDSPKVNILRSNFEYHEDISDMLWALRGTAVHLVLDHSAQELNKFDDSNGIPRRYTPEFKMEMEFKVNDEDPNEEPIVVTGSYDLTYNLEPKTLFDYKDTSVWKVKDCVKDIDVDTGQVIYTAKGKACLDWQKQTNCYAYMLRNKYGVVIRKIRIIVLLKDWKKQDAMTDANYPEKPIAIVDIPIRSDVAVLNFIKERIKLHKEAYKLYREQGIDAVPECNEDERWKKKDIWKMMSTATAARSSKNFEINGLVDEANAQAFFDGTFKPKNPGAYINKVKGFNGRCMDYCPTNVHCHFYKALVQNKAR